MTHRRTRRSWIRFGAAALLAAMVALAVPVAATGDDEIQVRVDIPGDAASGSFEVDNAQLRWGLNAEAGSGAFFGGCNFLSAGVSADAGGARVWSEAEATGSDPLFRTEAQQVRIEKPTAGTWEPLTWQNKCTDHTGRTVTSRGGDYGTGVTAVFEGGQGQIDAEAGTAQITWSGSVTVVFYGGMTYWWLTNPVLDVRPDGTGTLRADLGGYGADMFDTSKWVELDERTGVEIATLEDVRLGSGGIITVPRYEGVRVDTDGGMLPQLTDEPQWGSFPQGFVDFNVATGQSAYWYTSGGARDFAKPASTMWISYDAEEPTGTTPELPPTPPQGPTGPGDTPGDQNAPGVNSPGTQLGAGLGQDSIWNDPPTAGNSPPAGGAMPPAGGSAVGPAVDTGAADLTGVLPAMLTPVEWLSNSGLIPDYASQILADPRQRVAWSMAGVLSLSSLGFVGFRRGWFVLPWSAP